jgi:hypothetical protein
VLLEVSAVLELEVDVLVEVEEDEDDEDDVEVDVGFFVGFGGRRFGVGGALA